MVATIGGKRITQLSDFFEFYELPIRLHPKGLPKGFLKGLAEDGHLAQALIESLRTG